MDFLRRRILRESLHHIAGLLDENDLAFVKEVVGDHRFARLMAHVPNGDILSEELSEVLGDYAL